MAKLRKPLIWAYFGLCRAADDHDALVRPARRGSRRHHVGRRIRRTRIAHFRQLHRPRPESLERTHFFSKLRQYVFGASIVDWAKIVLFTVVLCGILTIFHWSGFGWDFCSPPARWRRDITSGVDKMLKKRPVRQFHPDRREMLKTMRIRGLDEEALRQFVCNYSGPTGKNFTNPSSAMKPKSRLARGGPPASADAIKRDGERGVIRPFPGSKPAPGPQGRKGT